MTTNEQLLALFGQVCEAEAIFDSLPPVESVSAKIDRLNRGGQFLGVVKVLSYLLGNMSEEDWQKFLKDNK